MSEYVIDESGKWRVQGLCKLLVEPSEKYLSDKEREEQQRLEQEMLENLKPSEEEIKQAEFEVRGLNLLMEVGLL